MMKVNDKIRPYWNLQCKEIQSVLWVPNKDNGQLDQSTHLVDHVKNKSCNLPSTTLSFSASKGCDQEKIVTKKIRIFPSNEKDWIRFLQASRRAYNLTIAEMRGYDSAEDKNVWKKQSPCQNQTVFRKSIREQVLKEFTNIPSVLIDESVNEAYRSQDNVIRLRTAIKHGDCQEGNVNNCQLNFRKRKDAKQSFIIQRLSKKGVYPTFLTCHITEEIPDEAVGKIARVIFKNGRWFLCLQTIVKISQAENQGRVIGACDPGIRTFLTTYSFFDYAKIGSGISARLKPMLLRLDKLISQRKRFQNSSSKCVGQWYTDRQRYFEKRIWSLQNKIEDLVHDLHKRAADWLTTHYDVILIPTFQVGNMVDKFTRKISSMSVRTMYSLSHYKFQQYLRWIALKRNKIVLECNEAFTSCTDSRTGEIVKLKSEKTINGMDRDVNGARGILLRALAT